MLGLWPFFTFFGGKWRAAPRYPRPAHDQIVEPFAGSAGYALRYPERRVILNEKDPRIAALWRFLIRATPQDILTLPDLEPGRSVDDLGVHEEARTLIGFWLNKGTTTPCKTPSAWMRTGIRPKSYWGPEIRARLAAQVGAIKHWTLIEGSYVNLPLSIATWFVDPPYQGAGSKYVCSARDIDYSALGRWCRALPGQVLVCENVGATWLPFKPFLVIKSAEGRHVRGVSHEALWTGCDLHLPRPRC